jgi:hypothetical protein
MPSILIVEKLGSIKSLNSKTLTESELYKKAGFKTNEGFKLFTTWNLELGPKKYSISLYGKTTGRANQENKYEFPPPVDKVLFFGNCILVNKSDDTIANLSSDEWTNIYEKLYGGFEDLDDEEEDDDEEDEDDDEPGVKRTKTGYVKDGFVVDDDDDEDSDGLVSDDVSEEDLPSDEDVMSDEDMVRKNKAKGRKVTKKTVSKPRAKKTTERSSSRNDFEVAADEDEEDLYLDCTSELCEEEYI